MPSTFNVRASVDGHGVSGFIKGCRCADCTEAERARARRNRRKAAGLPEHLDHYPMREASYLIRLGELDTSWKDEAACAERDLEVFYDSRHTAEAIAICGTCPVSSDCLRYALETMASPNDHGVWGGTTPAQRAQMHEAMALNPARQEA